MNDVKSTCANESQTDLTKDMITEMDRYNQELLLKAKSQRPGHFDWERYKDDNEFVRFYTGLPTFAHLEFVYETVKYFVGGKRSALSPELHILVFLLKLRMNYMFTDMAYQLGVSLPTVSKAFHETLTAFYKRSKFLVSWPCRADIKKNVPFCFEEAFGDKTTVIIDCFELFTDTPSRLSNHVTLYSNYKSHETIKYFIGISPQGVIIFISEGYGGRASDKFITNDSSFLDNLLPGDVVIADRGFTVENEISFYQAKLVIPAFTKGKKQLHPLDIENSRKIASVRIHVERVIGHVKNKFKIFDSNLGIDLLKTKEGKSIPTIDKIVHVACALTNLCKPVIPFT